MEISPFCQIGVAEKTEVTEVINMTPLSHPPTSLVDDVGEPRMDKSLGPRQRTFNFTF
jgi:hypothetical protein